MKRPLIHAYTRCRECDNFCRREKANGQPTSEYDQEIRGRCYNCINNKAPITVRDPAANRNKKPDMKDVFGVPLCTTCGLTRNTLLEKAKQTPKHGAFKILSCSETFILTRSRPYERDIGILVSVQCSSCDHIISLRIPNSFTSDRFRREYAAELGFIDAAAQEMKQTVVLEILLCCPEIPTEVIQIVVRFWPYPYIQGVSLMTLFEWGEV